MLIYILNLYVLNNEFNELIISKIKENSVEYSYSCHKVNNSGTLIY